jgi:hypothetical protein
VKQGEQGEQGLSERTRQLLRAAGVLAALVAGAGVMVGSNCTVAVTTCFDDDDDADDDDDDSDGDCFDDDDWDDDEDVFVASNGTLQRRLPIEWTLRDFALLEADEPGAAPAAVLLEIRGFSLGSKLGPGVYGDAEIRRFTELVLRANPALFELPEGAGQVRFDGIDHQEHFILVRHVQELVSEDDLATLLPDAAITFVLDLHGRLIEVQNTTRHDAAAPYGR